jgi:hypothetical protein
MKEEERNKTSVAVRPVPEKTNSARLGEDELYFSVQLLTILIAFVGASTIFYNGPE